MAVNEWKRIPESDFWEYLCELARVQSFTVTGEVCGGAGQVVTELYRVKFASGDRDWVYALARDIVKGPEFPIEPGFFMVGENVAMLFGLAALDTLLGDVVAVS